MANIAQNLARTAKLARRIFNSGSWKSRGWKSMMNEIYGQEAEDFGVDMLADAAGTSGAATAGGSAIELGGLGVLGWVAVIVALMFLLSLVLLYLSPLYTDPPPPALPHWADAIRQAPSEETLRELRQLPEGNDANQNESQLSPAQQLNKEIIERGGTFPGMLPKGRALDEGALQRQRMDAIISGDMNRYNQLIEEHRALYKKYGVDPCKSGFFPQGCQ